MKPALAGRRKAKESVMKTSELYIKLRQRIDEGLPFCIEHSEMWELTEDMAKLLADRLLKEDKERRVL